MVSSEEVYAPPSIQPGEEHWTETITTNEVCANCGAAREGNFCSECGQKHFQERLKFWELTKDLISRLTDLDAGLFHTFLALWRSPGKVAREYISGKQKPFVNPLTYFFIGAAAQILSFWSFTSIFREQFIGNMNGGALPPDAREKIETILGGPFEEAMADSYISGVMQGYSYAALFFFVFPFAIMLWILHGGLGEKFRLGESIVFSLFTYGHILLITAAFAPITIRIGTWAQLLMGTVVYIIYPQFAHSGFFQKTYISRFMTLLSTIIAWFGLICGINLIFIISFGIKLAFALMNQ